MYLNSAKMNLIKVTEHSGSGHYKSAPGGSQKHRQGLRGGRVLQDRDCSLRYIHKSFQ